MIKYRYETMFITFGESLKELRTSRNISQIELSKEIYVSQSTVSKWENGLINPTMSNLVVLSDYFDISIDELIGLK